MLDILVDLLGDSTDLPSITPLFRKLWEYCLRGYVHVNGAEAKKKSADVSCNSWYDVNNVTVVDKFESI